MKMFRSIGLSLALACGALVAAVSSVVQPLVRYLEIGCEALASGIDKLKHELAYKFSEDAGTGVGAGSGLRRESNGYRQATAREEDWLAPAVG